jgi:hypothetical protein
MDVKLQAFVNKVPAASEWPFSRFGILTTRKRTPAIAGYLFAHGQNLV